VTAQRALLGRTRPAAGRYQSTDSGVPGTVGPHYHTLADKFTSGPVRGHDR